jgi:hypothetical protein
MRILGVGQRKAYQIMRNINKELDAEGFYYIPGRVSKARFREKFYYGKPAEKSTRAGRQANTRSAAA